MNLLFSLFFSFFSPLSCIALSQGLFTFQLIGIRLRHVGALVRSHMNCLLRFESTIDQTTETMSSSPKTIAATTF